MNKHYLLSSTTNVFYMAVYTSTESSYYVMHKLHKVNIKLPLPFLSEPNLPSFVSYMSLLPDTAAYTEKFSAAKTML